MNTVFHYTSTQGAFGIIESNFLFATHYSYLNDSNELNHLKDILYPALSKNMERIRKEGMPNIPIEKSEAFNKMLDVIEADLLYNSWSDEAAQIAPTFLTSFCKHEEGTDVWKNGLLSQWRGYGSFGGCALEFDRKKMKELLREEFRTFYYSKGGMIDVIYDSQDQRMIIDGLPLRDFFISALTQHFFQGEVKQEEYQEISHMFFSYLARISPSMKSGAFAEENEVRIAAPAIDRASIDDVDVRKYKQRHFRYKSNVPVPYIRLFEKLGRLPINRILVGPQADQDKVIYSIRCLCNQVGLKVQIDRSATSYIP